VYSLGRANNTRISLAFYGGRLDDDIPVLIEIIYFFQLDDASRQISNRENHGGSRSNLDGTCQENGIATRLKLYLDIDT
jgi:hypothetical protein